MTEFKLIAMDTSKHVFTLHGLDAGGRAMLRRGGGPSSATTWYARVRHEVVRLRPPGRYACRWVIGTAG